MVTHDMIAEANGVKDIGYRGMVKSGNTLDMMFQSPWFKDATKGKFGGDVQRKVQQLKLDYN
jgi:hypothetical protein